MTEAGKRTAQYLDGFDDGVEARAAVDRNDVVEAIAAERARVRAEVEREISERIEDDGSIGRRAYGSLNIKPNDSGYIEVVGRAAVLRIIEGGSE